MKKIFTRKKINYDDDTVFLKHLKFISTSPKIKQIVKEYYALLKNQNLSLSREDFETLTANGEIFEQDIVVELFKNKESVKLEEIFSYLFKNHLKNINNFLLGNKLNGNYFSNLKIIFLKGNQIRKFFENVTYSNEIYPYILFHELGHVLSMKSFNNEFEEIGLVPIFISKKIFSKKSYWAENNKFDRKNNLKTIDFEKANFLEGFNLLDELINEALVANVANKKVCSKNNFYFGINLYQRQIFSAKNEKNIPVICSYNLNQDVYFFLDVLLDSPNFFKERFNSKNMLEKINSYKISLSRKEKFLEVLKFAEINLPDKNISTTEVICRSLAIAEEFIDNCDEEKMNIFFEIKSILQACLLSAIYGKIKNEKIDVKSPEFFEKIHNIDRLLIRSNDNEMPSIAENSFKYLLKNLSISKQYYSYKHAIESSENLKDVYIKSLFE